MNISRRTLLALAASVTSFAISSSAFAADYKIRIHTLVKSPHPYNDMAAAIKEEVEAKTDGRVEITIFDSGQLGQDPAVIGEMAFGTIDMMISSTSNAVQQIPEFGIFTMPYLFAGMDEELEIVGPGTLVHTHFENIYAERGVGMKLLALGGSGTRNMSTAKVIVKGPEDLAGMKMRTPPSPMDSETWSAFGMLPVTVAWGELYAAMQTGVAEAMESSLSGYNGSKLYEVAPYLTVTEHTIQANHISMSEVSWGKLPEDIQVIVQAAAISANILGVEKAKAYDAELVETLASEHGVTVTYPDKAAFMKVVAPLQAKLAQDLDLVKEYDLLKR